MFDIDYTPGSIDGINLSGLKKRFMYAVFISTILADKGKPLVRKYEGDYDDYTIHRELLAHVSTSTKASVVSSTILACITISKC